MHFDPSGFPGDSLFWEMLRVYWYSFTPAVKLVLCGYLFVVIYMSVKGDKKEKTFYGASLLVLIMVCLNPKLCRYLVDKWGFFERYFRFFWLVPVSMGYTHLAMNMYNKYEKKGRILLWVGVVVLFILSCRELVVMTGFSDLYAGGVYNTGMIPVPNIYKVEDDVIGVSNIIEASSGDASVVKKTLYSREFFIEVRTYDPALIPVVDYGYFSDFDFNTCISENNWFGIMTIFYTGKTEGVDASQMTSDLLKNAMANVDCEYVVLPKTNPYYDIWISSFECLGEAGRYTVLKVR